MPARKTPYQNLSLHPPPIPPPITTNSILNFPPSQIHLDALSTRIIIPPNFPRLLTAFITHKRTHGSPSEKLLYETLTSQTLISRLIARRPLTFMGSDDYTILRNGRTISEAKRQWDRNGTDAEDLNQDLRLEEYLSYDEIMLGSLIAVSGPSYFMNSGGRYNSGIPGPAGSFEQRGIVIGMVGARFEREDRMDCVYVLPSVAKPKQHTELTDMVFEFLGTHRRLGGREGFDVGVYAARMRITATVLLLEADSRAGEEGKGRKAYVYVVGLGLGVWERDSRQAEIYVETFGQAIQELEIGNVSTVEFAWIEVSERTKGVVRRIGREKGIEVLFSKRDPAEKLEGEGQLLVLSYAWDGNSFPGNEYWSGSLTASGDPAAACMSTVGELHNPVVNPGYLKRIVVAGETR